MCAEKVQRVLMALVVAIGTYFVTIQSIWGLVIIGFVVFMMLVWAFTDFCPSIAIFKKFLPSCYDR